MTERSYVHYVPGDPTARELSERKPVWEDCANIDRCGYGPHFTDWEVDHTPTSPQLPVSRKVWEGGRWVHRELTPAERLFLHHRGSAALSAFLRMPDDLTAGAFASFKKSALNKPQDVAEDWRDRNAAQTIASKDDQLHTEASMGRSVYTEPGDDGEEDA